MWKGAADSKKARCPSKEEIKKEVLESMIIDEFIEFEGLNKEAEEMRKKEKAAEVIERCEDIIKLKKKGIINIACYQGKVFKRFKEKEKFVNLSTLLTRDSQKHYYF